MKKLLFIAVVLSFVSCKRTKAPDVSGIEVNLEVQRFDHDFFKLNPENLTQDLDALRNKYPDFFDDYFVQILGLRPDSVAVEGTQENTALRQFLKDYRPVFDSSEKLFNNFDKWAGEIKKGMQYVKYYFPDYPLPDKVITFIGPMDAFFMSSYGVQGDVLSEAGLGVGLQLHLGADFSFYESDAGLTLYPRYISQTFTPQNIPVNAVKNLVDDIFIPQGGALSLIEQMVNSGRRYYIAELLLPKEPEENILGYTTDQLKGAYANEAVIWDFFLNNDLLNSSDQDITKNYIGQSPKTQEFGEGSPGNLGSFTGLQIVKKFAQKFPDVTPDSLMRIPPREIYERSKYKPKG
ncbi:MAG: hypothetical protein J5I50_04050 [Chitinophagaceae bacterium]|nr:hypothetical protein [Chitinophagaceae bacterium]